MEIANDNTSPSGEMSTERHSETSRLVTPGTTAQMSVINVFSYFCTCSLLGIIAYCCFSSNVSLFSFHPIFMSVGWMLFMSVAVNAITPGDVATEWMPIRLRSARHWVLQICTGLLVTIGFLIILSNKIINGKDHFTSTHGKIGLASFILMVTTMTGGIGALYSLKLKQYLAPIYTKVIHASAGLITYCLGSTTIIIGLFSHWWSFGDVLRYISLVLVLIITLITIMRPTLKVYFRLRERLDNIK